MTEVTVFVEPTVHAARKRLPGFVRQRVKHAIESLRQEPRGPESQPLETSGLAIPEGVELRRLRIHGWRVVYAVNDAEAWVWVLAIRRRPPYDYEDLA